MVESPTIDIDQEPDDPQSDPATLGTVIAKFSDRAIQRQVGGNAFLRGRLYARRGGVSDLSFTEQHAECKVKAKDQPIEVSVDLSDENQVNSRCSCAAWKGPTGHCKHVAALLVALRDKVRPPRPKAVVAEPQTSESQLRSNGKRRRSRKRKRGNETTALPAGPIELLSPGQLGLSRSPGAGADRGGLETWLPSEAMSRPCRFEYRLAVRAAAISVTPVLEGTRSAVPISEALASFNAVSASDRPLLRLLGRHTSRGTPATAELRGEDAAEVFSALRGRRVLLEPASMELRFADDVLVPKIELEPNAGQTVYRELRLL
ncbi:MAG: hypothetical protein IPJ88_08250 [Myxococcales bacterium]|nr:MAG: hypothetical protein IPJ88_08250 [Myxococcales bacterium]